MHSPGTVGTGIDVQRGEAIVRALDMEVEMCSESIGARHLPHFRAVARTDTPHETIYGCGSGHTPEIARHGALMECAERYAQFGCVEPRISVVDAYAALLPHAISPAACGLYSRAQYQRFPTLALRLSQNPIGWNGLKSTISRAVHAN